jgi:hypothetical protein
MLAAFSVGHRPYGCADFKDLLAWSLNAKSLRQALPCDIFLNQARL